MSTNLQDQSRSSYEQRKLDTTLLPEMCESSELLSRRKKARSPKRKQRSPSKLTKDEIKYQRFVHDLKKDIEVYMKKCIRESRFDTRNNPRSKPNLLFQNRQDPMSFLKYDETKRIAADVQTILTGPAMKAFYTQFIRPLPQQKPIPFEESFLNISEHQETNKF